MDGIMTLFSNVPIGGDPETKEYTINHGGNRHHPSVQRNITALWHRLGGDWDIHEEETSVVWKRNIHVQSRKPDSPQEHYTQEESPK